MSSEDRATQFQVGAGAVRVFREAPVEAETRPKPRLAAPHSQWADDAPLHWRSTVVFVRRWGGGEGGWRRGRRGR